MNWWYCFIRGRQYGPVTEDVLRGWVVAGRLRATDYVWTAGMAIWAEGRFVGGLFEGEVAPPDSMVPASAAAPGPSPDEMGPTVYSPR